MNRTLRLFAIAAAMLAAAVLVCALLRDEAPESHVGRTEIQGGLVKDVEPSGPAPSPVPVQPDPAQPAAEQNEAPAAVPAQEAKASPATKEEAASAPAAASVPEAAPQAASSPAAGPAPAASPASSASPTSGEKASEGAVATAQVLSILKKVEPEAAPVPAPAPKSEAAPEAAAPAPAAKADGPAPAAKASPAVQSKQGRVKASFPVKDAPAAKAPAKAAKPAPAAKTARKSSPAKGDAVKQALADAKAGRLAPVEGALVQKKAARYDRVVTSARFSMKGSLIKLTLRGNAPMVGHYYVLESPDRVVLDLAGNWEVEVPPVPSNRLIRAVRVGQHEDKTRLVFDMKTVGKAALVPLNRNALELRIQ